MEGIIISAMVNIAIVALTITIVFFVQRKKRIKKSSEELKLHVFETHAIGGLCTFTCESENHKVSLGAKTIPLLVHRLKVITNKLIYESGEKRIRITIEFLPLHRIIHSNRGIDRLNIPLTAEQIFKFWERYKLPRT